MLIYLGFVSHTLSASLLGDSSVLSYWILSLIFIFLLDDILLILCIWFLFIFSCSLSFRRLASNILFQIHKIILIFFSINLLQIIFDFLLNRLTKNLAFNSKLPIILIPRFNHASYKWGGFLICSHRFRYLKVLFLWFIILFINIQKISNLILHILNEKFRDCNNFLPAFFQNNYAIIKIIKCPFYHFINFFQLLEHLFAFYLDQNLLQLLFNQCFGHQNILVELKKCWILINHFRWIV